MRRFSAITQPVSTAPLAFASARRAAASLTVRSLDIVKTPSFMTPFTNRRPTAVAVSEEAPTSTTSERLLHTEDTTSAGTI